MTWPSPAPLAAVAGLVLAGLSFWWPPLAAATLALCSLGGAACAARSDPASRRRTRGRPVTTGIAIAGFAAAWVAFVALPTVVVGLRALALAAALLVLALLPVILPAGRS